MQNVNPDFSQIVSRFPTAVRAPFLSLPPPFLSPGVGILPDFLFFLVVLLNKDIQRVLRRSPQALAGVGAAAPPAPLPLIVADAVAHPNVSVESER